MFIEDIGAPEANSTLLSSISSFNVNPSGGAGNKAEPPPQIKAPLNHLTIFLTDDKIFLKR